MKKDTIEFIEVLITTDIEIHDRFIHQKFFYDKKFTKYLTQPYYTLYNKLEAKLRQISFYEDGIEFIKRENDKGEIVLIYEASSIEFIKKIDRSRKIFKLVDFVPPNPGCAFCIHKKVINEDFFYCEYKEKTMTKEIKTCGYFKQKKLYKT